MKLIDKDALVAEIENYKKSIEEDGEHCSLVVGKHKGQKMASEHFLSFLDTLEVKEVIAEQECTCNEALNHIIGGSWNLLCPVNKLGLKTGDKVNVIIEAHKGE